MNPSLSRLFFLVLFYVGLNSFAQPRVITVRALDAVTQKPIRNADIFLNGERLEVKSNHLGFFQVTAQDSSTLMVVHIGYHKFPTSIPQTQKLTVLLMPKTSTLPAFTIEDSLFEYNESNFFSFTNFRDSLPGENHAHPAIGWPKFYQRLAANIRSDSNFHKSPFKSDVFFSITTDNKVDNIVVDGDTTQSQLFKKYLAKEAGFIAAKQGDTPIQERFRMSMSYGYDARIFLVVDQQPEYVGGYESMMKFIRANLRYPASARRLGIDGTVYASFVILEDGTIDDIYIIRGIQKECDDEVVRMIGLMPKWVPGRQMGKPVKVRFNLPVKFKLNGPGGGSASSLHKTTSQVEYPLFPGGYKGMSEFLERNKQKIDALPNPNRLHNTVHLRFKVDSTGSIQNIKVVKGIGKRYDEEAVRLYSAMPPWTPGKIRGEVRSFDMDGRVEFKPIADADVEAANALLDKGAANFDKNDFADAADYFRRAMERDPTNADLYFNRGVCLLKLGQTKEGCLVLERIKSIDKETLQLFADHCGTNSQ